MLEARLAQMHVHIDEARSHHQPGGVEKFTARRRHSRAHAPLDHGFDESVLNPDVGDAVVSGCRIDHPAILNE